MVVPVVPLPSVRTLRAAAASTAAFTGATLPAASLHPVATPASDAAAHAATAHPSTAAGHVQPEPRVGVCAPGAARALVHVGLRAVHALAESVATRHHGVG